MKVELLRELILRQPFFKVVINRNVYILPPPEARQDGILWQLKKTAAVYGLDDAPREWYFSVKDLLLKNDCKQSSSDKALFRWYNK